MSAYGKIKVRGFVLTGFPFGESHKIYNFLSIEHGIIKIVAHGARKVGGKFGSSLELFNELELVITGNKSTDLYNISEVTLILSSHNIRQKLYTLNWFYYLSEFVSSWVSTHSISANLYNYLRNIIFLIGEHSDIALICIRSFQLKLLFELGFTTDIKHCALCTSELSNDIYLTKRHGLFICNKCKSHNDISLSNSTLSEIRSLLNLSFDDFILDTNDINIYNVSISNETILILSNIFSIINYTVLDKKLKTDSLFYGGDIKI